MSRAFTREDDAVGANSLGERPVSPHRNLVTADGLAAIDAEIAGLRERLAAETDRETIALLSRDLRYWTARRETAEVVEPDPASNVVRFGMTVTIEDEDGAEKQWTLVGEDEADPSAGTISHASPMAAALFGKSVGDEINVAGRTYAITGFGYSHPRARK